MNYKWSMLKILKRVGLNFKNLSVMADLNNILPSQLMQSVLGKLYEVLTQGDDTVPASKDNFLSWCSPGIPVTEEDFDFVSQGLSGVIKPPANGDGKELTPEEKATLTQSNPGRLYTQAESFSRMVDFIPDINAGTNGGLARLSIKQNEGTLSDVYKYALDFSQVANTELSDEEKKQVERFRELLQVKKMKKDLVSGEETEVVEPSPLVLAYNEKMNAYLNAVLEYNKYRVDALTGENAEAVHFWALNASTLRKKVQAAKDDWVNNGYQKDYEGIAARLDQIMSKDLSLLKAEYKDALERTKLTGINSGADFYYATLAPANFIKGGWTQFSFDSNDFAYHANKQNTSYKVKASASYWGFHAGGSKESSEAQNETTIDATSFKLSFDMCQVQVIMPGIKTAFLTSKAWKLDPGSPEVQSKGEVLCDGNVPPAGILPGYPTSAIFVKNLVLDFGKSNSKAKSSLKSDSSAASGGGYWGVFSASGSKSSSSSDTAAESSSENQGIKVDGMQIIGFNCHVLPKSPDPLPNIKNWI